MSYVNASDILPKCLVDEIQKYIDGQILYIPRKGENTLSWGEKSGTKENVPLFCIIVKITDNNKCEHKM